MILRHTAIAAVVAAISAGLCPFDALAAERDCPGMIVGADAAVRDHWPDLVPTIESRLSTRADIDRCVHVDLRLVGNVIMVSVTLPDGRAASRALTNSDDVIPTLQGLLLVPELVGESAPLPSPAAVGATPSSTPRRPAIAATSSSTRAPPHQNAFVDQTPPTQRDQLPTTAAARSLGIELSLFTGARLGDGQLGIGAGALSFVELDAWLIGFVGRADSYRPVTGGDRETALELAILAGRRFELGSMALDVSAGPGLAVKGSSSSQGEEVHHESSTNTDTPPDVPPPVLAPEPRSGPVPRVLLGARLGFGPRSVLRGFVGIDGEVGAELARSDPSSARLPAYSAGLSVGATVGTP